MMPIVFASFGFPWWLRVSHLINLFFIGLLIRSGIQILAAHPRLYWNDGCKPSSNWLNFTQKKIPKGQQWTSMDEEVPVSPLIAQPGQDNLGLGRHWHFFSIIFWVLNGIIYVVLLFATGEWGRLIPTSWSIFPQAWSTFLTYITFHIPPLSDFHPYDPLQQLAYAGVVFLLGPFMLLTGAAMSLAVTIAIVALIFVFGFYALIYEVIDMTLANHPQTILAYEMNGEQLPVDHGAPLRLRVETLLGYKMVKYLDSIELVEDYKTIGEGHGGYREDFQYYGRGAEI